MLFWRKQTHSWENEYSSRLAARKDDAEIQFEEKEATEEENEVETEAQFDSEG